ncbi:four helix bundle protein [Candidatus Nomurabacteria bacterium]|nr:four helix bundle protein [Candidatus Nomurabacteria bacterium]
MNQNDVPVLNKSYELYKLFHEYRKVVPKQDRFTIYERSEHVMLGIIELLLEASYGGKERKLVTLEKASVKLNVLRFLIRIMKETKTFDMKKYISLELLVDEIGRMIGGWIRSLNLNK